MEYCLSIVFSFLLNERTRDYDEVRVNTVINDIIRQTATKLIKFDNSKDCSV